MAKITAATMVELKAKIYAAEGWTRICGESAAARIKAAYEISMDKKGNKWIAIRKKGV